MRTLLLLLVVVSLFTPITSYCNQLSYGENNTNSIDSPIDLIISSKEATDITAKYLLDEFQMKHLYPTVQLKSCKLLYDQTQPYAYEIINTIDEQETLVAYVYVDPHTGSIIKQLPDDLFNRYAFYKLSINREKAQMIAFKNIQENWANYYPNTICPNSVDDLIWLCGIAQFDLDEYCWVFAAGRNSDGRVLFVVYINSEGDVLKLEKKQIM